MAGIEFADGPPFRWDEFIAETITPGLGFINDAQRAWDEGKTWRALGNEALAAVDIGLSVLTAGGYALAKTGILAAAKGIKQGARALKAGRAANAIERNGVKFYRSFGAFKRAMGPAGQGMAWHHIVEQTPGNVQRFGGHMLHNTENIVKLPHGQGSIHAKISGYYSSIQFEVTGSYNMTVREWLSTQSYQTQYEFGIQKLKDFGWTF